MSSIIPIESASDKIADLEHAIKDLEAEHLELSKAYGATTDKVFELKAEVNALRVNQQKNAKHYNKRIQELALMVGSKRISWKTAEGLK
jgi:predicted  nucleic acid-binding Zn-ribbon protein